MIFATLALAVLGFQDAGLPKASELLTWADRAYGQGVGYPRFEPAASFAYAADKCEEALERFGEVGGVRVRLGRVRFQQGRYSQALAQFRLASYDGPETAAATQRFDVEAKVRPFAHGKSILQVLPLQREGSYLALLGVDRPDPDLRTQPESKLELVMFRVNGSSVEVMNRKAVLIGRAVSGKFFFGEKNRASAFLSVENNWFKGERQTAFVYRYFEEGGSSPVAIETYQLGSKSIGREKVFTTYSTDGDIGFVFPATPEHELTVRVVSTPKVWWPDLYEWKSDGFVLADSKRPELYRNQLVRWTNEDADGAYGEWMFFGAQFDARHEYAKGLWAWKRAEKGCLAKIRYGSDQSYDHGYYGEARVNLGEIRKRIRWLKSRDYNHALLYRPYDFDLEVPPYRIGKAGGS